MRAEVGKHSGWVSRPGEARRIPYKAELTNADTDTKQSKAVRNKNANNFWIMSPWNLNFIYEAQIGGSLALCWELLACWFANFMKTPCIIFWGDFRIKKGKSANIPCLWPTIQHELCFSEKTLMKVVSFRTVSSSQVPWTTNIQGELHITTVTSSGLWLVRLVLINFL